MVQPGKVLNTSMRRLGKEIIELLYYKIVAPKWWI